MDNNIPPDIRTWLGHEWRGREWGAPILASGAVWVTAGAIHTWDLPFVVGLAVGAATTIAIMVSVGSGRRFSQALQLHLFTSSIWAMAFLTWSSIDSAWVNEQLRNLTLVLGLVWPIIATLTWKNARFSQINKEYQRTVEHLRTAQQQPAQITAAPANTPKALWEGMFAAWGVNRLTYVGQRATPEGNRVVRMRLPADGSVRFSQVTDKAENVEITMASRGQKIPPGSVRINRVRSKGQLSSTDFVILIDLVDVLSQIRWMPEDHTPRSITEAFQIGVYQDGTAMFMTVVEIHWAIVAMSRAGKSNLLHDVIYQVSRCYDAVIWAIDMKGASTIKPWGRAWADRALHPDTGKPVLRPVIDWPAVDKHEAERMLNACIEIAADRPFRRTGSKHRPTREHPHILLIADEVSRLTGTHANTNATSGKGGKHSTVFGALFTELASIGAGEAVTIIYANQRNTVDSALPGNAQANFAGRVCLGAADLQDVRMVLPKNPLASSVAAALRHKGSLVMAAGEDDQALAGRTFFMGDDDELDRRCYEAGLIHGDIVPGLTEGTPEHDIACKWGYADRYEDPERIGWMSGTRRGPWVGKPIEPEFTPEEMQVVRDQMGRMAQADAFVTFQQGSTIPTQPTPDAGTGFFTAPTAAPSPDHAAFDQLIAAQDLSELAAAFEDASSAFATMDGGAAQPDDADRVQMLIDIVDSFGMNGAMAKDITDELIRRSVITRKGTSALYRYLIEAMDARQGDRRVVQPGGPRTRYYTQRHIHSQRRAA